MNFDYITQKVWTLTIFIEHMTTYNLGCIDFSMFSLLLLGGGPKGKHLHSIHLIK